MLNRPTGKQVKQRWMAAAEKRIGMKEIPGKTHNHKLIDLLNTAIKYNGVKWVDDEMPWCGGFVAAMMLEAGIEPVKIAARAKSWATWGTPVDPIHLVPGTVLVFTRNGGGHVGFYVGEDATAYHVLGGNQNNMVNITRIAKSRLSAARWPKGVPFVGSPVLMATKPGQPLSTNEA